MSLWGRMPYITSLERIGVDRVTVEERQAIH